MDEERRIRFLVAPALFVASLLIGALLDPAETAFTLVEPHLKGSDWTKPLIELVAGGGVVVFAGGYVFGTIAVFILRLISWFNLSFGGKCRFHEVALPCDSFKQVWTRLGAPGEPDRSQELSAGAVFDFDVLRKDHEGVHRWLFRRWNGFNIATNSICALISSLVIGPLIKIPLNRAWCLSVLIFAAMLGVVGFLAWLDTMRMLRFMASLEENKPWPKAIPAGKRAKPSESSPRGYLARR